jgi:hypothetical protein
MTVMTIAEIDLCIQSLAMAASRHEAQARWLGSGRFADKHDKISADMRRLRAKLIQEQLACTQ